MCPFHLMLPVDVSVVVVQKSRTTVIKVYIYYGSKPFSYIADPV